MNFLTVRLLNEKGIEPDIVIGRCSELLNPSIKEKIASYCNILPSAVISGPGSNEVPQPHERTARGFWIRNPAPARSSL